MRRLKISLFQRSPEIALPWETPAEAPPEAPIEAPVEVPVKRRKSVWMYFTLLVIMVLVLGGVWFFRFNTSTPVLTMYPSQRLTSSDWSGYTVSTDLLNPQAAVTSVSSSWTIPQITASTGNSFRCMDRRRRPVRSSTHPDGDGTRLGERRRRLYRMV